MAKITFLFADSTDWLHKPGGALIKFVEGSSAGHFAVLLETDYSKKVYEAVSPKARVLPFDEWSHKYQIKDSVSFDVPEDKLFDVVYWLESQVGVRYGYLQLPFILLCSLSPFLDKTFNETYLNHKKAIICTELGSRLIEKFLVYEIKESHDKIGIKDMDNICLDLRSSEIKWRT